jgi:hypothetical protein
VIIDFPVCTDGDNFTRLLSIDEEVSRVPFPFTLAKGMSLNNTDRGCLTAIEARG